MMWILPKFPLGNFDTDLDNDDASGLQITLEEEDGAIIRVSNPEGATASDLQNVSKSCLRSEHEFEHTL
ncbi:MAG: hypothetical protein Ct9H300mP21_05770 [Pseudomonadota bacterium]|nr:MAG: hypothetical protein Ct9H300mP21_05770 [Pseudomonadota bacterium]